MANCGTRNCAFARNHLMEGIKHRDKFSSDIFKQYSDRIYHMHFTKIILIWQFLLTVKPRLAKHWIILVRLESCSSVLSNITMSFEMLYAPRQSLIIIWFSNGMFTPNKNLLYLHRPHGRTYIWNQSITPFVVRPCWSRSWRRNLLLLFPGLFHLILATYGTHEQ